MSAVRNYEYYNEATSGTINFDEKNAKILAVLRSKFSNSSKL